MRKEFIQAIKTHESAFGLDLPDPAIERLSNYYDLVMEDNPLLHLVGPCSDEEFAIRHILESLTLLEYLPEGTKFADVGAGAGLPSVPCLLVREDLRAELIETKEKKAKFLDITVDALKISDRAKVINRQFQEADAVSGDVVTCRALDKFTERIPRLLKWSGRRRVILFGGENLRTALQTERIRFTQKLLPLSEQRFLFVVEQ